MSNRKHRDNQEICSRKVRELAQSGVNKHCFECNQPGVTYTDITVGTFVCTSCSGMLRGLNPPHRVKSISMTTFSQQEVEFLQNHGNEDTSWVPVCPEGRTPRTRWRTYILITSVLGMPPE
ncbi:Arf-GAP domain and FG repeat-containing protein 2 [Ilyodon furcidens]|uniref:Arf-GAP domain and FG repeat-containing protein 2 n=1 Tax=Ilyodon furcidens TaxID=33524 RepID=A0ABV0V4R8_9TELE